MSNLPGNDHVAVAKFRLEGVHDWQSDEGSTDATNLAAAIDAQTHATLAVAYEQRTANLLKVLELQGRMHDAQQAFNLSAFDVAERLGMRAEK